MRALFRISAAAAALLVAGSVSAFAACNGDAGTETVLGAASGAAVGGLASHSVAGAAIGGVAGGVIGNAIGQSNNREDCRREAQYYDRQGQGYYQGQQEAYGRDDYNNQTYSQQDYAQQRRDYEWQRQNYEQQRQAYDSRYPGASRYYSDRYGRQYDNSAYGTTYSQSSQYPYSQPYSQSSQYPYGRSSRYSDYRGE